MGLSAGGVVPLGWDWSISSARIGERVHTEPEYGNRPSCCIASFPVSMGNFFACWKKVSQGFF